MTHHLTAIEQRAAARQARIDARRAELPSDLATLVALAKNETDSEMAIAINEAIIEQDEDDVVAYNRLGRGYARGRLVRTRWARLRACARTRSQRGASPSSDASSGKDPELTATAALLQKQHQDRHCRVGDLGETRPRRRRLPLLA